MELHNRFDVPVPPRQAFDVLRDIQRIGPCMPGATIDEVDGDHFTGRVKVKIGPIQVTYRGEADYVDVDEEALTATINARGRESRGAGTADATVRARITDGPDGGATVEVTTDLAITGKPAQFGRGVMAEVGEKLITQFATCLSEELGRDDGGAAGGDEAGSSAATDDTPPMGTPTGGGSDGDGSATPERDTSLPPERPRPASPPPPRQEAEAIDLLEVAGAPVAQRLAPVAAGLVVLWLLVRLLRRRRG